MATAAIIATIALFVIGVIIITSLYIFQVGPYGDTYSFRNPRTWAPEPNTQEWLNPTFDYGMTSRNVPSPEIKGIYCKFDPNKCIPDAATFDMTDPPTGC